MTASGTIFVRASAKSTASPSHIFKTTKVAADYNRFDALHRTEGSRERRFRGSPDGKDLPVEAGGWTSPACNERPRKYRERGR